MQAEGPLSAACWQHAVAWQCIEGIFGAQKIADMCILLDQVVGAGRGPLVWAALNAARQTELRLKIYAIEKNPNAVVTLHKLVAAER